MANVETAVYARLKATAGLTAKVGARISPPPASQDSTFPLVTYEEVVKTPLHSHDAAVGTSGHRIRVHVWAKEVGGSRGTRAVADAVEAAFVGWSQSEQLNRTKRWDGSLRMHGVMLDFRVWNIN